MIIINLYQNEINYNKKPNLKIKINEYNTNIGDIIEILRNNGFAEKNKRIEILQVQPIIETLNYSYWFHNITIYEYDIFTLVDSRNIINYIKTSEINMIFVVI